MFSLIFKTFDNPNENKAPCGTLSKFDVITQVTSGDFRY